MGTILDPMAALRSAMRRDFEAVVGRHDQDRIFGGPAGDRGLVGGPKSVSWRLHADTTSIVLAGPAAILMEVLEPSVMAGVEDHSSYRQLPMHRAKTTFGYVLQTTYGSTDAATNLIERVKSMHGRVEGVRPDGIPYRALDPDLIAWVHTCIPWAIMTAYDRFCHPLSTGEKDQYLGEQAVIGRMGGGEGVPESTVELDAFVERMRPRLAMTDQTRSFVDFLTGDLGTRDGGAAFALYQHRFELRLSMSLMPIWARKIAGLWHPHAFQRGVGTPIMRAQASFMRKTLGPVPAVAIAQARAATAVRATSAA